MGLSELCDDITARGEVTVDDVLAMRRAVFGEIAVTPDEVEALFIIDEGTARRVAEWRIFFVEALTEWLVRQQQPVGYVTQAQADWLIDRIGSDKRVRNGTELETVVRVLELADDAPDSLAVFGLSLVTRAVVENDGVITADEVQRMRRLMFAPSGPGRLAVTRAEAEALFDLNDATRGAANDPSWTDFFMRAVANAVTAAAGWAPPGREEALRRERWLADPEATTMDAIETLYGSNPAAGGIRGWMDYLAWGLRQRPAEEVFEDRLEANATAAAAAAPVDLGEARWLIDRIGRDGAFDVNERALVGFLRQLDPGVDRGLKDLVDRLEAEEA